MRLRKKLLFYACHPLLPFVRFRSKPSIIPHNLLLPLYHAVSDKPIPHLEKLYRVKTVAEFERDVEFLLAHFSPATLADLKAVSKGETLERLKFILTIDDGLRQVFTTIRPVLKRFNLPAIVFVNPAFVDNRGMLQRFVIPGDTSQENFLIAEQPYMTLNELSKMSDEGVIIGAHSMEHPDYRTIPEQQQLAQTTESLGYVGERFGSSARFFAFPYTDDGVALSFFEKLKGQTDLTFGSAGIKRDRAAQHLQRVPMEDYGARGDRAVKFEYLLASVRERVGRNVIRRK